MSPPAGESRWSRAREAALPMAVHAALFGAIWLAASASYAVAFAGGAQPLWLAIDAALVAAALAFVRARWELVGFSALGARKAIRIGAVAAVSLAVVALAQYTIADKHGVWLDESNYLATLREGRIIRDGTYPFNMRWLAPFLAGPWNLLPVDDAAALKALSFGALVTTAVLLSLLLVRLGVRFGLALTAPVFLMSSYLGVYAGVNRLVLDPFNYAMFAVLFHALLRREHAGLFGIALLVAALNSEKAVYWIPAFALVEVLRAGPGARRALRDAALRTARICGPAVAYLIAIRLYLSGSQTVSELFLEHVHVMAFTWMPTGIANEAVKSSSFQILWFPFGAFTVLALLGFAAAPRTLRPIAVLLGPIMLSVLVANDTQRMIAYAFIVYLPFGYLYLDRALADLPRRAAAILLGILLLAAICRHYLLPALAPLRAEYQLGPLLSPKLVKQVLAAVELLSIGGLVFVHHTFFGPGARPDAPAGRPA